MVALEGVVFATRMPADGQGYCLRYGLNGAGAKWLERVLDA